jgi:N-hydroxyarylamine O-acetyltransferase
MGGAGSIASATSQAPDHELNLDAYLNRIGLGGHPTLAELHRAHVTAIPFENLDPLRGVPISLQLADIERKLVAERRGGYCFEHNLLFGAVLRAFGAQVEPMLARVGPREDRERSLTHLLLRVRDGSGAIWHADVGFGAGTLLEPIAFGPGPSFEQQGWRRRVVDFGTGLVLQTAGTDGVWPDLYRFTPVAVPQIDIELSNWFTCTHPRSMFIHNLNVTVQRADGSRLVLRARGDSTRLIEQTPAGEAVEEVDREAIPGLLAARFGLPGWTLDERGVPVPG